MRKIVTAVLGAYALVIPVTSVAASLRNATRSAGGLASGSTVTRKLTGTSAQAGQWGTVQVIVTAKATAVGSKLRIRYTDLGGSYSYHTSRSQFIMSQALPMLRQEFLSAQSANVQLVAGATLTSEAFQQSLQAALLKAPK